MDPINATCSKSNKLVLGQRDFIGGRIRNKGTRRSRSRRHAGAFRKKYPSVPLWRHPNLIGGPFVSKAGVPKYQTAQQEISNATHQRPLREPAIAQIPSSPFANLCRAAENNKAQDPLPPSHIGDTNPSFVLHLQTRTCPSRNRRSRPRTGA